MDTKEAPAPGAATTRQARAVRNDGRVLDAALDVLVRDGWVGLVPSRVAAASGLSRSTVQYRYPDRAALAAALWDDRCLPPLTHALGGVVEAVTRAADGPATEAALLVLARPTPELLAASELLVTAHYDSVMRERIAETVSPAIADWLGVGDRAQAARTAYALMVGLGALLTSRRTGADVIEWSDICAKLATAAQQRHSPTRLPDATAPHITGDLDLAPDDPALDALLNATLREIGSHGYEGASVDRIARASHHTKGLVFSRFPSKLELFVEATRRQQSLAFAANEQFISEVAARHGRGVAEAVTIRELQRPHMDYSRSIAMEQLRVTWHSPQLKRAQEADLDAVVASMAAADEEHFAHSAAIVQFAYSVGLGMALLPLLDPRCFTLPYDVMTVPLVEMGL